MSVVALNLGFQPRLDTHGITDRDVFVTEWLEGFHSGYCCAACPSRTTRRHIMKLDVVSRRHGGVRNMRTRAAAHSKQVVNSVDYSPSVRIVSLIPRDPILSAFPTHIRNTPSEYYTHTASLKEML